MKRGSKDYGFNTGNENRVKIFREKNPENLGMKTWIQPHKPLEQVHLCTGKPPDLE